ncbi:MAG: hypothetical protein ACLTMP_07560 [Eggerthella lenta]
MSTSVIWKTTSSNSWEGMLLMFKYLRMDAYRLIKTKTLYVALGIILAAVAFSVYMMSTAAMPDLSATGGEGPSSMAIQNGKELGSFTQTQSGLWIWTTVLLVSVVVAQFFALDFSSGFVKSLPLSRRDRLDYYGGKIVFVVMLSTAFSVFGIAVFEILLKAAGFAYAHADSSGNRRLVRVAAACPLTYGMLAATATWLTRSRVWALSSHCSRALPLHGSLSLAQRNGFRTAAVRCWFRAVRRCWRRRAT